jgi:hypothetical protein
VDRRRGRGELERGSHPVGGNLPGQAESAPDVLVVDEAVGQRDPAAEAGGQSVGLEVLLNHGEQVVRGVVGEGGDAEGVDAITVQPAGEELADERDRAQGCRS